MKYGLPKTGNELMYLSSWRPDDTIKSEKQINHYEIVQEINIEDTFCNNLSYILEIVQDLISEHSHKYEQLFIQSLHYQASYDEYKLAYFLVGKNLESISQRDERLKMLKQEEEKTINELQVKEQEKEKKELALFNKLKAKYAKNL